jgi:hypothetical protein
MVVSGTDMRFLKWIMARLGGPRAGRAVIALAVVLGLPSLFSPLFIDEYVQAVKWKAAGVVRFLNDCFVFATPAGNQAEMEHGYGAWWTAPDFKVAFWRPVSAATHAIDHALWPGNAVLMHVHTLLWFLALLLAVQALYRRFLAPGIATLALALYAWDDARGMVLSWIANRHALIAGLFGASVLVAHDKWRRDGWKPGAWLGPVLLVLGLLSSEMALATMGFLFGYALFLDKGTAMRRMARLWPHAVVVLAWQALWLALGNGTQASGGYTHPLVEPLVFAAKMIERVPILAFGQLTPVLADAWGMFPPAGRAVVFALAIAALVIVARVAWPRLGADPRARFWLIGAGLSLLVISTTAPQDRNLVFVGFGVAPALAMLFSAMLEDPPTLRWPRVVAFALAVFNLALAPVELPLKCLMMRAAEGMMAPVDESIPRDPAVSDKTLVVVWTAFEPAVYFSWTKRDADGIPRPGRTRILATSLGDVSVTRLDEVTLRLQPRDGFFASEASKLMRGASRPFLRGDVVTLSNMKATVTEITDDGRPLIVEFRFAVPLESPEWLWMRGAARGLVGWTPPKVGQTVVVPVVTR